MDKFTENGLLSDYYGSLLSKRQREVVSLYYEDNWSLSEIAEEFGISRQGVHDALHAAEKALAQYEAKLGLLKKEQERAKALRHVEDLLSLAPVKDAWLKDLSSAVSELKE